MRSLGYFARRSNECSQDDRILERKNPASIPSRKKVSALQHLFAHVDGIEREDRKRILKSRERAIVKKVTSNLAVKNGSINLSLLKVLELDTLKKAAKLALRDDSVTDLNLSVSFLKRRKRCK